MCAVGVCIFKVGVDVTVGVGIFKVGVGVYVECRNL